MSFTNGFCRIFGYDRHAIELSELRARPAKIVGYTSFGGLLGYGIPHGPLEVVNVPEGCEVARIRCRPNDFTVVYLRRGKTFEAWYCDYADETRTSVRLTTPKARNQRF